MKVKIFTCNSFQKIHPRIVMQVGILSSNGYDVEVVKSAKERETGFQGMLNMRSLKYFRWAAIKEFKLQLDNCDIVHIYDFQLLPLAIYAKKRGKKVVYETLDDNVHLHFYALKNRIPLLGLFQKQVINFFSKKEKNISRNYCDSVIVNSANLLKNFNNKSTNLIYYASNLKASNHLFDENKEVRFLYVGKLTKDKGAAVYEELIRHFKVKLIFYGHFGDNYSKHLLQENNLLEERGNLDVEELDSMLKKDIETYNIVGLSVVFPVNESYKFQEANKDIDYITMSIPFVGNDRPPTLDKIKKGAGVLNTKIEDVTNLLENKNNSYNTIVNNSYSIIKEYSLDTFRHKLLAVYKGLS